MPKQRQVYAMRNFLGLDKENKPIKVEPYRASDGYNFKIDSMTLKTRDSFIFEDLFEVVLPLSNDSVVDFYQFKNRFFIVTKNTFYLIDDGEYYDLINDTTTKTKLFIPQDFEMSTTKPIFKEEKEVLFIFGVGGIFVLSINEEDDGTLDTIIFYEMSLASSMINPFSVGTTFYSDFVNLPRPYVPTLFIGDNAIDDINMLSKKTKYLLFANQQTNEGDDRVYYTLPTVYDPEKHGDYTMQVEAYGGKYDNVDAIPVFLGISHDTLNFTDEFLYDTNSYGAIYNTSADIEVDATVFAQEDFEYSYDTSTQVKELIKGYVRLTKDKFFYYRESITQLTIFEYIMDVVLQNEFTSNKVLKFSVPLHYREVLRDSSDVTKIIGYSEVDTTMDVYIQLRVKEGSNVTTYSIASQNIDTSDIIDVLASSTTYPAFPDNFVLNTDYDEVATDIEEYEVGTSLDLYATAYSRLTTEANIIKFNYNNGDRVRIGISAYREYTESVDESVSVEDFDSWDTANTGQGGTSFPSYPSFSNPNSYPVIEIAFSQSFLSLDKQYIRTTLLNYIQGGLDNFQELVDDSGTAFAKFRFVVEYTFGGNSIFDYYSIVAQFDYQKDTTTTYHERIAIRAIMDVTVISDGESVFDNVVTQKFIQDKGVFELSIKDIYFDYNLEPSIEVVVTFDNNEEDYKKISLNTFGTFFGSENRLFLAGNPDYPNIDRYNVSNDLLGNNVANQSYELSYFPSKNYRVVGGKGAINGYVVATDSQLYVTKDEYINDSKLFIRERSVNEEGIVSYFEFKTSVLETPINERCLVRFYNDVLILTKNGLYGVEISSNVLTNERLLKLRSAFINEDLKAQIASTSSDRIFMVENNRYLFIIVGQSIYVADSRYLSKNENSENENLSYEIMKWKVPHNFTNVVYFNQQFKFLEGEQNQSVYVLQEGNNDEIATYESNWLSNNMGTYDSHAFNYTSFGANYSDIYDNPKNYGFNFGKSYIYVGNSEGIFSNAITVISNQVRFPYTSNDTSQLNYFLDRVSVGDSIYIVNSDGGVEENLIFHSYDSDFVYFDIEGSIVTQTLSVDYVVFVEINQTLYPDIVFRDSSNSDLYYMNLTNVKPDSVEKRVGTLNDFASILVGDIQERASVYLRSALNSGFSLTVYDKEFLWVSSITDFGNNLVEKTLFRTNVYATKKQEENDLVFGFKTMRKLKTLEDGTTIAIDKRVELANTFDFGVIDFTTFGLNTFNEFGMSIPTKENNFLYIQFLVKGTGDIELNALEYIYKENRKLKSIG